MILETTLTRLDELYDDFITNYELGNFTDGICQWNGDDALMGPKAFAHLFKKRAEAMGFKFEQYSPLADELEEWCHIRIIDVVRTSRRGGRGGEDL